MYGRIVLTSWWLIHPKSKAVPVSFFPLSSPTKCQCENQLAHWDWKGTICPNLPEKCWQTLTLGSPVQSETICSSVYVNNSYIYVQGSVSTPKLENGSDGSTTSDSDGGSDDSTTSDSDGGSDDSMTAWHLTWTVAAMTVRQPSQRQIMAAVTIWQSHNRILILNDKKVKKIGRNCTTAHLLTLVIAKWARRKHSNRGQGGSTNQKTEGDTVNIFIESQDSQIGHKRKYEGSLGGGVCKKSKVSRLVHIASHSLIFCKGITCIRIEFCEPPIRISIEMGRK